MCEPATILMAAGLAVSAGAGAYGMSQQSAAASAQKAANDQAIQAQNAGFWSRNQDARQQIAAQGIAQATAQGRTNLANAEMRTKQGAALDTRDAAVAAENQRATEIRAQADTQQQALLDNTNQAALTNAQSGDLANRTGLMAPGANDIAVANPLAAPGGGAETKTAYASRLAEAAQNVRTYGQRLAQVSSYTAPLTTVGQAISKEQAGIMPVAAANQLLQSGQGVRLLPSQTAYDIAGGENRAKTQQIGSDLEGELGVAKNQYVGDTGVADLEQGNTTQIAKNAATTAQSEAAANQALASMIASAGNIAAYGGARYGASINGAFASPGNTATVANTPPVTRYGSIT